MGGAVVKSQDVFPEQVLADLASHLEIEYDGLEHAESWLTRNLEMLAQKEDPWNDVAVQEQLRRVTEDLEELEEVVIQDLDEERAPEVCCLISNDDDDDSGLKQVARVPTQYRGSVVAMNLNDHKFGRLMEVNVPWIRNLSLVGAKPIERPISFHGLPRLLVLDISYVDTGPVDLRPLSCTLTKLTADGCGWTQLPASVAMLSKLLFLSCQDNLIDVDHVEELIAIVGKLGKLKECDFRENPFQNEGEGVVRQTHETLKGLLPCVEIIDNKILKSDGVDMNLKNIPHLREEMLRTDTVADHNEDRGSCSCIEGTPCEVEYTCKDWKHRFEIAQYARENP